jgi:ethanolamine ammonia-lyase large subunit
MYRASIANQRYVFEDVAALLAKASPLRSGDALAGIAAGNEEERVAAQSALADLPLRVFLDRHVVPYRPMKSPG